MLLASVVGHGNAEAAVIVFGVRVGRVLGSLQDQIRFAERPLLIENQRLGQVGRVSLRGAGVRPARDEVDLGLLQATLVDELAVPRNRFPGRHAAGGGFPLDRLRPRLGGGVVHERERGDLARVMADLAARLEQADDPVVESDRFAAAEGERDLHLVGFDPVDGQRDVDGRPAAQLERQGADIDLVETGKLCMRAVIGHVDRNSADRRRKLRAAAHARAEQAQIDLAGGEVDRQRLPRPALGIVNRYVLIALGSVGIRARGDRGRQSRSGIRGGKQPRADEPDLEFPIGHGRAAAHHPHVRRARGQVGNQDVELRRRNGEDSCAALDLGAVFDDDRDRVEFIGQLGPGRGDRRLRRELAPEHGGDRVRGHRLLGDEAGARYNGDGAFVSAQLRRGRAGQRHGQNGRAVNETFSPNPLHDHPRSGRSRRMQ